MVGSYPLDQRGIIHFHFGQDARIMKWNKIITTEQEYEKALSRLAIIFEADPDSAEGMEAELLVTLIEKYEKEHYPVSFPDPIDAIRESMERKGLKDKNPSTLQKV